MDSIPEMSILQAIYPLLAPLPVTFAEHVVRRFERARRASSSTAWDVLVHQVQQKRDIAYTYMHPFVAHDQNRKERSPETLSTGWLNQALSIHSPKKRPVPRQTLSNWHTRGLLRYEQHGVPELDSAATLLITRLIDQGEDNWLPSSVREEEPRWWCWRQDAPHAPVIPCPVPLPLNVPPAALLWTPWAGAAWRTEWLGVGKGLGAIRFAGIKKVGRNIQWTISASMVQHWCPGLEAFLASPLFTTQLDEDTEDVRRQYVQALANTALYTLALSRFHIVQ